MGLTDELQKLEELRQSGAVSLEEYNKAKATILRQGSGSVPSTDLRYNATGGGSNTFKFATAVWLIVGLLIPLWPISLPACWYMAYRSYKSP